MIQKEERPLTNTDKEILLKEINTTSGQVFKKIFFISAAVLALLMARIIWMTLESFGLVNFVIALVSILVLYQLYYEVKNVRSLQKHKSQCKAALHNGLAKVTSISVDPYAEFPLDSDGNRVLLIEHNKQLALVLKELVLWPENLAQRLTLTQCYAQNSSDVAHAYIKTEGQDIQADPILEEPLPKQITDSENWKALLKGKTINDTLHHFMDLSESNL